MNVDGSYLRDESTDLGHVENGVLDKDLQLVRQARLYTASDRDTNERVQHHIANVLDLPFPDRFLVLPSYLRGVYIIKMLPGSHTAH